MKLLIATLLTQGTRSNDFAHATEHELVAPPIIECDNEPVDGSCGCRRAFFGLTSLKSTTTALVVDYLDMRLPDLHERLRASFTASGWRRLLPPHVFTKQVEATAQQILQATAPYPPGIILERRGDLVVARTTLAAA